MTPAEADSFRSSAAAYVHIPFCSAVCPYCDFAVVAGRDELAERYVRAVVAEVQRSDEWRRLDAVYFGGGTPSHLDPSLLAEIVDAIDRRHGIRGDAEVSLEANPEDFGTPLAVTLMEMGFNRVSFGAQSFDEAVLTSLGRRHSGPQIESSVRAARDAGFENVSLDLIYGTPEETDETWESSLHLATELEPDHVSAYALTVEPGTELWRSVRSGSSAPDPDVQADRYAFACDVLAGAGLRRYEVSNWASPGRECRYNLTVWAQGEYLAYGNGAHGYLQGRRFRNYRRIDTYIESVEAGESPVAGFETVRGWEEELDRIFVGLRRSAGVAAGPGVVAFAGSEEGQRLLELGVVRFDSGRLTVSDPMLTDEVNRVVLGLSPTSHGWAQAGHGDIVSARENA